MVLDVSLARAQDLARRVRWFDRYRHAISVIVAAAIGSAALVRIPHALGPDWPVFHARVLAIVGSVVVGFAIEVGLAAALAVWEVQHDQILRDRGLPRAELVTSRWLRRK